MNNIFAGILGGVFFIELAGLLAGPLIGVSESAILPLAGVALGAAVLSIYFQKRASTRIPRGFEETKEMARTSTRLAIIEALPSQARFPQSNRIVNPGYDRVEEVAIFAAELGAKLVRLTQSATSDKARGLK